MGKSKTETKAAAFPAKPRKKKDPYYLRAVGKALEALEILRRSPGALSLAEMASRLHLTKSSTLRVLHTLEVSRHLRKTEYGRYAAMGNGCREISPEFVDRLIQVSTGPLKELVREFRETVGLAVLYENHIEVVSVVESPEWARMGNTVGRILPPHASALGKCIAAFQPEARRENLMRSYGLVRFTQNTIVDELKLKEQYERISARGYSTDEEESTLHGHCYAAPVTSPDGDVVAAISISPLLSRVPLRGREKMIEGVMRTARAISEALKA
jgi:IclR family acetate operon transcriptional repressor